MAQEIPNIGFAPVWIILHEFIMILEIFMGGLIQDAKVGVVKVKGTGEET